MSMNLKLALGAFALALLTLPVGSTSFGIPTAALLVCGFLVGLEANQRRADLADGSAALELTYRASPLLIPVGLSIIWLMFR